MKLLAILIVCSSAAFAQSRKADTSHERGVVMGIHVIGSMTPSASSYFSAYQKTLGGKASAFPALTGVGGSMAIDFSPVFSVVLHAQTLALAMDDVSSYKVLNTTTQAVDTSADASDHWSAQTYPFLVGVRLTPIPSRYQSFVVVLGGFAVTHLRWDHIMYSTTDAQRFHSGTFEATTVAPTIAIGAGFEMLFDQFGHREVLRGISIEARYRWVQSSVAVFGPLAASSRSPAGAWAETYPMNFGGFELMAGLHFQFYH